MNPRITVMADFIAAHATDIESALYGAADARTAELGESAAYETTAAAAVAAVLFTDGHWFGLDVQREVRSIAADMRELVGLPRHATTPAPIA